jgi:hypothetical protein
VQLEAARTLDRHHAREGAGPFTSGDSRRKRTLSEPLVSMRPSITSTAGLARKSSIVATPKSRGSRRSRALDANLHARALEAEGALHGIDRGPVG